jgi:hypothetical protein
LVVCLWLQVVGYSIWEERGRRESDLFESYKPNPIHSGMQIGWYFFFRFFLKFEVRKWILENAMTLNQNLRSGQELKNVQISMSNPSLVSLNSTFFSLAAIMVALIIVGNMHKTQ